MSSYYDDDEMGPVMRERDEEALDAAIREREDEDEDDNRPCRICLGMDGNPNCRGGCI